ncbi:unnamed protein product [Moneuplotes crassus]|uniref:TLC domain-containing protein n=1 Tax=Euplotes crassus TaxID=5936 RepID=A0AAD1XLB6_EUPCR|nr:unnamed protein product [Moneuplotes crassus]
MIKWLYSVRDSLTGQQFIFLMIFFALLSVIPILYNCCEDFARYRRLERPDYDNTDWYDYMLVAYLTPLVFLGQILTSKITSGYFRSRFQKKFEGEALDLKVHKATKNCFKFFYYCGMVSFGYYVYSDTNYHSSYMFGEGNMMYLDSDWPFNKQPRLLKLYYMAGISYHTSDMIHLFLNSAQKDFFEMLLHHYITIMLIIGSYMTNFWNSGINVMLQMDVGEIFVGSLRCINDIWSPLICVPLFVVMNIFWVYLRIIVFAKEVIIEGSMIGRWRFDQNTSHQTSMQVLLMILLLLNCYWQILFFNMLYRAVFKGDTKDYQNPVEDIKTREDSKKIKS